MSVHKKLYVSSRMSSQVKIGVARAILGHQRTPFGGDAPNSQYVGVVHELGNTDLWLVNYF